MKPLLIFFSSWPYDDALNFMEKSAVAVKEHPTRFFIGCGSHKETVITYGRHVTMAEIEKFKELNYLIRKTERGGGITAHEPGQLVLYPCFSLLEYHIAIPELVWVMEEAMINFLKDFFIDAHRLEKGAGVFIGEQKIGFIGLRIREHVVSHGMALNLLNDGAIFSLFDPCGIQNLKVTSACFHQEFKESIDIYMKMLTQHFLQLVKTKIFV